VVGLHDAAARGRRLREEKARAEREAAQSAAVDDGVDERRLARLYGVDPDGYGYAIYLGVMAVVIGVIGAGVAWWANGPSSLSIVAACAGLVGLWAVVAYAIDARARRSMAAARARLRNLPFPFDADDYERVAAAFDHFSGWARVSIQFDEATLAIRSELRGEITDAMTAFGADAVRWASSTRLWVRSVSTSTDVSSENASYSTARAIHTWIEPFVTRDLRDLHASAPITNVSVRFGFFEDGSFTVDEENESE